MQCQKGNYAVVGEEMQSLEITLEPGESLVGQAGVLNYMNDAIRFEAVTGTGPVLGNGFLGRLAGTGRSLLTGESLFLTRFTNIADGRRCMGFSAPYPGKIIVLDLSLLQKEILCQRDVFLCATDPVDIRFAFARRIGSGFFGGHGFVLQRLQGEGAAFIQAGGTMVKKELQNEVLLVDTGCILAFTPGIHYRIDRTRGLQSLLSRGRGIFLATLSGTGTVFLQTLPFSRMADRLLLNKPARPEKNQNRFHEPA